MVKKTEKLINKYNWLSTIHWDKNGLIPVIVQEKNSKEILMFAWMNRIAFIETVSTKMGVYWSRSRNCIWRKGEKSGNIQYVKEIKIDCDKDVVLLTIIQVNNITCHTGRYSCFFQKFDGNLENGGWFLTE